MRGDTPPSELFARNRARLRDMLKPRSLVVVHANDIMPTNADGVMGFRQNTDLFHLCGVNQEDTILMIHTDAWEEKDSQILFIRKSHERVALWEGRKLTKQEATLRSGIQRVEWNDDFDSILREVAPQADHIYLATNEHPRARSPVETRNDRFIRQCIARYPLHRYERLAPLMHRLRMVKQPEEIEMIRKACRISESGFRRVLEFIRPGVGEWEIEAELIHEYLRLGSRGFAYPPIIGSGENACVLHYVENMHRCMDGQLVLMDVAAEFGGWNADLTRTVPVNGRFTRRQRDVYDAVLRVLRTANGLLRPGNTPRAYQRQVIEVMEHELVGLGLFTAAEAKAQGPDKELVSRYFMHGTSHHLGLDVHDVAPPHEPFAEHMVFTIEPGIYIREEGIGVRLENNVLVGKGGNIDLMAAIPIEAEEIEDLMNR